MSLEKEIQTLNASIQQLIAVMSGGAKVTTPATEVKSEPVEVKSETLAVTHDDLKEELLKAARRDRKVECKELLAKYGAKKVTEIPTDKIEEMIEKAKGL